MLLLHRLEHLSIPFYTLCGSSFKAFEHLLILFLFLAHDVSLLVDLLALLLSLLLELKLFVFALLFDTSFEAVDLLFLLLKLWSGEEVLLAWRNRSKARLVALAFLINYREASDGTI